MTGTELQEEAKYSKSMRTKSASKLTSAAGEWREAESAVEALILMTLTCKGRVLDVLLLVSTYAKSLTRGLGSLLGFIYIDWVVYFSFLWAL